VPNKLVKDSLLNNMDFRIYIAILMRTFGKSKSFPSQDRIAEDIGLTSKYRRTIVNRHVKNLVKFGYLKKQHKKSGPLNYYPQILLTKDGIVDYRDTPETKPP